MNGSNEFEGPLGGLPTPVHGGRPGMQGCGGCIDCCHLPEISVTAEEAALLSGLYHQLDQPESCLRIIEETGRRESLVMLGPCAFRRSGTPLESGGCRIHEERPGACRVFTCQFLLDLRRVPPA
jgi:Fe-S-cluster containining protein